MKLLENITTGAVEHPLVTSLIGIFIALLGAFGAIFLLALQQEPPVKIPVIIVSIPYPGASPWEVQSEVIQELEEKLKGLENVEHIYSTAAENFGVTSVEFTGGVDVDKAKAEVRERADQAKAEFPEEVEEPVISDVDFDDLPIIFLTLTDRTGSGGRSREEILMDLNQTADTLEDHILQVPGVSTVDRYGELKGEVRVRLDPKRMEAYGLSFEMVARAIADQNLALPGGTLDVEESTFAVRMAGKFSRPEELKDIVVGASPDGMLHLRELVETILTYKKTTSYSRLEGVPGVTLILHQKTGENVVGLINEVKEKVRVLKESGVIRPSIRISYTKDQSYWIWEMLSQLGSSAIFGGILVVVVLYFGMGMRSGFLLASAIPFSILFCCLCQTIFDISINSMTLFSLILILGMVVDGAIVVGENIYRHFEMGKRPKQAALDGIHEVGMAVISADLTTISAFLPMLFMTGIMGFWMEIMPMIVTFTLAGSILVDHFILPVLCRYFMRVRPSIARPEELSESRSRRLGFGVLTSLSYFLARHRVVSLFLCVLPAVPLGWYGLEVLENLVASFGGFRPDWSENGAYRFLAICLVAVAGDYLLRRKLNVRFGRRPSFNAEKDLRHLLDSGGVLTRGYLEILRFALSHRLTVAVIALMALSTAILLPLSGRLRTTFFEDTDSGWYFIKYELPPDSSLEQSYEFASRLERVLKETIYPSQCLSCGWNGPLVGKPDECPECGGKVRGEVKSTVTTMGDATATAIYIGEMGSSGPEFGRIEVELYPKEKRLAVDQVVRRGDVFSKNRLISFLQGLLYDPDEEITVHQYRDMFRIMDAHEEWLHGKGGRPGQDRFPGVKIDVMPMPMGPPVGAPITARVKGRNLEAIVETARTIESICQSIPECYGIQNTHYEGRREVRVVPDRDRAALFGLFPRDIARALFTAFQGWEVSTMNLNDEEVDIRLENDDLGRQRIEDARDMEIATPYGGNVSLRDIARIEVQATVSRLKRFDRRQSITVTCEIQKGADSDAIKRQVRSSVEALSLPEGVTIEFGGQDEEQTESVQSLLRAFGIAAVLIFFILTGQFNSLKQPVLVMLTIPLSIVGSIAGLYITGNPLDFLAMVGIVCLTGIVVNDAIVLVDFLNKLRRKGVPLLDATVLAGKARLRPILMTTITTVVGLLPLTLNLTGGADFWETMGYSIIFGLAVATVLTLVVIPTFYSLIERDSWEPSVVGRWRREIRLRLHKRKLHHLLSRLQKEGDDSERRRLSALLSFQTAMEEATPAGVEELLALEGDAYRRLFFRRALSCLDSVTEMDLAGFALLCRRLSGCTWRVDTRLGEYQRPMIREEIARWVEHDGTRAPLGTLEKSLG